MASIDPTTLIPNKSSKFESWITYHQAVKKRYGKKTGNALWTKAWSKRGSPTANTNALRTYLAKNNIVIDKSAWDSVVDKGIDVADNFSDMLNMGKWVTFVLVAGVVIGVVILVINIARKPAEVAKIATTVGTRGLIK